MASKKDAKKNGSSSSKKQHSGRRPGRPRSYKPEFAHQAKVACKEGGFTDLKLALLFKVSKSTINNWKKDFPEFLDSIKEGKDFFDTTHVEKSFLKRAIGYRYTENHQELIWVDDPKAKQPTKEEEEAGEKRKLKPKYLTVKKIRKEVVPDSKAAMDWLCNRNPGRWKKLKHVELTGKDGTDLINADTFKAILSVFPSEIAEQIKIKVLERLGHQ
jgi:hypothetical protein